MPDYLVSVSAGLFGLVGPGLLAWALGPVLWRRRAPAFAAPTGFVALIPAHQEESTLPGTLRSLRAAAEKAGTPLRIVVGADRCTDATAALAEAQGAAVARFDFGSKWRTLEALALTVKAGEWVALVDAGAHWPASLLADLANAFGDRSLLAIAPAYYPTRASRVEKFLWRMEARWKLGENRAGGPVSVHGATVFYRAEALRSALARLDETGRQIWLNDDVVLPLAARLAHPGGAILYWCPAETDRRVSDEGLHEEAPQFGRRRRMVAGNLEWTLLLLPAAFAVCPAAALVALRRLFRVFWAYWFLFLVYGVCALLSPRRDLALFATVVVSCAGSLALVMAGKRSLAEAAVASLYAPALLPSVWRGRRQAWN